MSCSRWWCCSVTDSTPESEHYQIMHWSNWCHNVAVRCAYCVHIIWNIIMCLHKAIPNDSIYIQNDAPEYKSLWKTVLLCMQKYLYQDSKPCKRGGPFVHGQNIYKSLGTKDIAAQFLLLSHAIPTTIPDAQNPIECRHCTGKCFCLLFMVIKLPRHNHNNGELYLNTLWVKSLYFHFWLLHWDVIISDSQWNNLERQHFFFAHRAFT